MPHLTGPKEAAEAELAARLKKLAGRQRREIIAVAGWPPNFSKIPESLWNEHEDEMRDEIASVIVLLFLLADGNLSALAGLEINEDRLARRSEKWGVRQATRVARDFTINTRRRVEDAVGKTTEETTKGEFRDEIEKVLSETRAETVAKTETRTAVTEGETAAADDVNRQAEKAKEKEAERKKEGPKDDGKDEGDKGKDGKGDGESGEPKEAITLTAYWGHDEHRPPGHAGAAIDPCPICTPLLGRKLSELPLPFQSGPPAHPICDCYKEYRDQNGNIVAGKDDNDKPTLDRLPAILKGRDAPPGIQRWMRPERFYRRRR